MDRDLRIKMTLEALDKVTAPLRDIATSSGKAGADISATRQKLNQLNAETRNISGFRQLKAEVQTTGEKMRAAETRATQLGRELAQTVNPTKKLQQEFKKAKVEADDLRGAHQKQTVALQEMRGRIEAAGMSTRNLAQHERELRAQIGQTNAELDERVQRLNRVNERDERLSAGRAAYGRVQGVATGLAVGGATSVATGAAIVAPLKGMAEEAMAFEDVMADVRKVVDFDTPDQFKAMGKDIMALSERLPMTAEGIAAIVAAGGQANIPRAELMAFAEDATKMGIAFEVPADQAGDMMAKWRTAFGMGREEVIALADQVNYLGNTTTAGVGPISDILTRIGPLGEVGGLAARSIAALGATIASMGTAPEIAATGIKNLTLAMTKGEAATKGQQKVWASLGLSAKSVSEGMQKDADATILMVLDRLKAVPKEAQAGLLTQLFGSESVGAIAPLLTQLDTLKENYTKVGDATKYAGSMEAEYAERSNTTSSAVELSANAAKNLKATLGDALSPTIKSLAANLAGMAQGIRGWASENPVLARTLLLLVGGLGALLVIFGGLAIAVAGLLAPFAALSFAAATLNVALLPVIGIALAVVAAIALVAAAAYYVYQKWDGISAWFGGLWTEIKGVFDGGIASIAAVLITFSPVGLLYQGFAALMRWLAVDIPAKLSTIGGQIVDGLINGITARFPNVVAKVKQLAGMIPDPVRKVLGIHSPSRVFAAIGGHITDGLSVGLDAGAAGPLKRAGALATSLAGAFAAGSAAMAAPIGADLAGANGGGRAGAAAAAGAPAQVNHYTIAITVQGGPAGPNIDDFARKVRTVFEQIEREKAGRAFRDN